MAKNDKAAAPAVEKKPLTFDSWTPETLDDVGGFKLDTEIGLYSARFSVHPGTKKNAPVFGWAEGVHAMVTQYDRDRFVESGGDPEAPESEIPPSKYIKVRLTKPTICARNTQPYIRENGIVWVPATTAIAGLLEMAENKKLIYHFAMIPTDKSRTNNKREVQNFEVRVLEIKSREQYDDMRNSEVNKMLTAATESKALPSASAAAE